MQFVGVDTISIFGKSAMNARAMFAEKQLAKKVAVTIHALVALTKIVMNVTHIIPDLRRLQMVKITIELSCEEDICGDCEFLRSDTGFVFCHYFIEGNLNKKGNYFIRLPECKQAEVKDE